MANAVLTAHESSWKVRGQDVFFDAFACVPDVGDVGHIDCTFHWWVFRSGIKIREEFKGRQFSHFGEPGDEVVLRFWDAAGNYGGEDRYVYGASDVAAFAFYCDATGGNDANPGTEAQPFQTIAAMVTAARAALTANNACVLYLKRGETFTVTTALVAGGSTRRQFQFEAYDSGAVPQVNVTLATLEVFNCGVSESYRIGDINFTGVSSAAGQNGYFINLNKTVSLTGHAHDVVLRDCTVSTFQNVLRSADNPGSTGRGSGLYDFVRVENVECVNSGAYHFYGLQQRNFVTIKNVTYGNSQGWSGVGERFRLQELGACIIDDLTANNSDSAGVRLQGGDQDTDTPDLNLAFGPLTARRIVFTAQTTAKVIDVQSDAPATYMSVHNLLEFHDCNLRNGYIQFRAYGTANQWFENVIVTGVQSQATTPLWLFHNAAISRGRIKRFQAKNNSGWNPTGGGQFFECSYPKSKVDDDAFVMKNNALWQPAGTTQSRQMFRGTNMSIAEFVACFAECEGNHFGKSSTESANWINTTSGTLSLASWQSTYSFDLLGTQTRVASDPLGWTAYPTVADGSGCDPRITSDASPLHDGGYETPSYDVDSDGHLYSTTTRTAGAFQFFDVGDPVLEPEMPTPTSPGPSGAPRMRRHGLVLGLRLRP